MEIIKSYATNNECYQVGRIIEVRGLVLHSVGTPQPDAELWATSIYNQYRPSGASVCVHAFLQADGKVYQTLPWNYEGWHAGGSANSSHIGIEMCEPDTIRYTGGSSFQVFDKPTAQAYVRGCYETAVQLFAQLCKQYGLNPLQDGVIISHAEGYQRGVASNHGDPEHLWNGLDLPYTMNGFRRDVHAAMSDKPDVTSYKARIIAPDGLNVRQGPGTSFEVFKTLPYDTEIKVCAEQNGWGKIETDGWVSLDWIEKTENSKPEKSYTIRITCAVLNIREGAGTGYPVIGQIQDKLRYTIMEEKAGEGSEKGWGRLKSGGWIALDWVKKA